MKLTKREKIHYDNEIATAELINLCYDLRCSGNKMAPKKLAALIMLTWWSPRDLIKIKALWILWDKKGNLPNIKNPSDLLQYGFPKKVIEIAEVNWGIVNFYKAYRKTGLKWVERNYNKLNRLVQMVIKSNSNLAITRIAEEIELLPKIPKGNNQPGLMSPQNLVTPLFACLDPRNRFPIINKAEYVQRLHRKLNVQSLHLTDKVSTLIRLYSQFGIKNNFMLDCVSSRLTTMNLQKSVVKIVKLTKSRSKPLGEKDDSDIETILKTRSIKIIRLHNSMTNSLLELCNKNKLQIEEGREPYKFDALIRNYDNTGKDLLVEAKGTIDRSQLRLAVGQLFDYRRGLKKRAVTDLAVLLPNKPKQPEIAYLNDLAIGVAWFANDRLKLILSDFDFKLN